VGVSLTLKLFVRGLDPGKKIFFGANTYYPDPEGGL
jgi:hypothetical protein